MSSKLTGKPGSVVDSHSSRPAIAHWLKQPTRVQYGPYLVNPYLALLRVEFTVPRTVASRAVRSYRTLSPLPDPTCVGHRRFALCCTGRGFPPQALPGTLPYGARTFLPSVCLPRRRTATKRRLSGQLRRAVYRVFTALSLTLLLQHVIIQRIFLHAVDPGARRPCNLIALNYVLSIPTTKKYFHLTRRDK